ncbi:MAG: serine/threonine protein kinase, partial [bacterium]|nr:serine/threonine protein kinase [bacterium]
DSGFTETGLPYLAMELMEKGSAADHIATLGPVAVGDALHVVARIADAVEQAHAVGVLHRDIKPENILFSAYDEAKLTDFGVAAMLEGTATATASITATVEHAAPEILAGSKPTPTADVYSLGSTLFALLTGHSPFRKSTDESVLPVLARVATEPIPDLRGEGFADDVCEALESCLAKDPSGRIASAGELAEMLRTIGGGTQPSSAPTRQLDAGVPPAEPASPMATVPVGATRLIGPGATPPSPPPATPSSAVRKAGRRVWLQSVDDDGIAMAVQSATGVSTQVLTVRVGRRIRKKGRNLLAGALDEALRSGQAETVRVEGIQTRDTKKLRAALNTALSVETDGPDLVVQLANTAEARSSDSPSLYAIESIAAPPPLTTQPLESDSISDTAGSVVAPSRLIGLLGVTTMLAGALLPFQLFFRSEWGPNIFSDYVWRQIWGNTEAGETLGAVVIALTLAAGLAVFRRARRTWVLTLAVLAGLPAIVFLIRVLADLPSGRHLHDALRAFGSGPTITAFGLVLVVAANRTWKTGAIVASGMAIWGSILVGFDWPFSRLWDQYMDPSWYNSSGLVLLVLCLIAGLLVAIERALLSAIAMCLLATSAAVAFAIRFAAQGENPVEFLNLMSWHSNETIVAVGTLIAAALVWRQRSEATSRSA